MRGAGIAATIQDVRLDRPYRSLKNLLGGARADPATSHCGFTDPATLSRTLHRRFGMAPWDVLGNRRG